MGNSQNLFHKGGISTQRTSSTKRQLRELTPEDRDSIEMPSKDNNKENAADGNPVDADMVAITGGKKPGRPRDELFSSQWLFALIQKHKLVDEASLDILMEYEYDVHMIKKHGAEKLMELGVTEASCKNLVRFAASM